MPTPDQYQRIGKEAVSALREVSETLDRLMKIVVDGLTTEEREQYDRLIEAGYAPFDALDYLGIP